jgi:hypothetical protein
MRKSARIAITVILFFAVSRAAVFPLHVKSDETVVIYPSAARFDAAHKSWEIPVHVHVFEIDEDSLFRKYVISKLGKNIPLANETIFDRRMHLFMMDNQRRKQIDILIGTKAYHISKTAANGHIEETLHIPDAEFRSFLPQNKKTGAITIQAVDTKDHTVILAEGKVFIPETETLFVISDIDDTIKISDVRNKSTLIENTFSNPFKPVPGMAELYRTYAAHGALICYISASPWQLYSEFKLFLRENNFPDGVFRLKYFRIKDSDFFNLFMKGKEYKIESIEPVIKQFPHASFILIGDSGEQDPEAYAFLAEKYPTNIKKILIRQAYQDETARYKSVFKNIPGTKWQVFIAPGEIRD